MTRSLRKEPKEHTRYAGFAEDADHNAAGVATTSAAFPTILPARLDHLKERGFGSDELYALVAPRRTLARRIELGDALSPVEADRVMRLERISDMADRVFGDAEKAQRWLRKENRALERARPIDLLQTETGAHLVEQELHRIDYGLFA